MRKTIIFLFVFSAFSATVFAQSLDKLTDRARHVLALRVNGNKSEAVRYFEPASRNDFLDRKPFPMSNVQVTGLELTDDAKMVYVVFKATFTAPDFGPFQATVREPWIWDGKDWFLRLPAVGNPFDAFKTPAAAPLPAEPAPFELQVRDFAFGKHVQGEVIKRTVEFKSDLGRVYSIRAPELPGLFVSSPVWTSKEGGALQLALDTTLLSQNVDYTVNLEISDSQERKTNASLHISAEIEPRLRFSQTPDPVEPLKAGVTTVRIENVSGTAFKPLNIISTNPAYKLGDDVPKVVEPGQSMNLTITNDPQPEPTGETLNITISDGILAGSSTFVLPLHVNLPVSRGAGYSKEELEQILRMAK
jgi:hypothetical protein